MTFEDVKTCFFAPHLMCGVRNNKLVNLGVRDQKEVQNHCLGAKSLSLQDRWLEIGSPMYLCENHLQLYDDRCVSEFDDRKSMLEKRKNLPQCLPTTGYGLPIPHG